MTPVYPDDLALKAIAEGLRDHTLPRSVWSHAAHLAAALWFVRADPAPLAETRLPALIRGYNAASGTPNTDSTGYHETITLASLRAVRSMANAHGRSVPLYVIHQALMASPLARPDWLLAYWSRERLFSPAARRAWIKPDLASFPY